MLKIISLLLIANLAIAQNNETSIETLNRAQYYVNSMSTAVSDPLCTSCTPVQMAQRCYQEICANISSGSSNFPSSGNFGGGFAGFNIDPETMKVRDELKKKITELLQNDLNLAIREYTDKEKAVNNSSSSKGEETERVVAVFNLAFLSDGEETKDLPETLRKSQKQFLLLFKEISKNLPSLYTTDSTEEYFKKKYPDLELKEAVKKEVIEVEKNESALLNHPFLQKIPALKKEYNRIQDLPIYNDIVSEKDYMIDDLDEILETNHFVSVFIQLFNSPKFLKVVKEIDLTKIREISQSQKIKDNLAHFKKVLEVLDPKLNIGSNLVDSCVNDIMSANANLATEKDFPALATRGENVKNNFFNNVISKFSNETSKKIQDNMKKWQFTTKTKEQFLKSYDLQFRTALQENSQDIETYKRMTEQEKQSVSSDLLEMYTYNQDDPNEFVIDQLTEYKRICVDTVPHNYNDAAYNISGKINVSYGSLEDSSVGDPIMFHELGHLLRDQFKKNKLSAHSSNMFKQINSCLTAKHKSTKYVEEDFADLTSAIAVNSSSPNLVCALSIPDFENPLVQPTDDGHSNHFFRLLHIQKVKEGKLPASCGKFMELSPIKKNFDSCWPENKASK